MMTSDPTEKRLKVGIFFNARRSQGGLYQYAITLVDCLARFGVRNSYILFHANLDPLSTLSPRPGWEQVELPPRAVRLRMLLEYVWLNLARSFGPRIKGWLPPYPQIDKSKVDLMLYVKPGIHPFLWPYPAVFPIHDLQHRLQPEFKEVSAGGEFNRREYFYQRSVPRARAILTDSEVGREDVINSYVANPERVFPLPYLAFTDELPQPIESDFERVRRCYSLPERYFFYPAAFWSHKNHARLIRAIKLLVDRKKPVHLVLAASRRNEYDSLVALVRQLDLSQFVHFIGYLPDKDQPALYFLSSGLVMPTFFGPTNIPILEAWGLDCPVISSDIHGIREQVGDAGILVDPQSEQQIADAMMNLEEQPGLRGRLIERGRLRIQSWGPSDFARRLEDILSRSANSA